MIIDQPLRLQTTTCSHFLSRNLVRKMEADILLINIVTDIIINIKTIINFVIIIIIINKIISLATSPKKVETLCQQDDQTALCPGQISQGGTSTALV